MSEISDVKKGSREKKRKAPSTKPTSPIKTPKQTKFRNPRASALAPQPRSTGEFGLDLCGYCQSMFLDSGWAGRNAEEHWERLVNPNCDSCELLANAFLRNTPTDLTRNHFRGRFSFRRRSGGTMFSRISIDVGTQKNIYLTIDYGRNGGSIEIPEMIDYNALTTYLQRCQRSHGKGCGKRELPLRHSQPIDIILIDVIRDCITMRTTACNYFALSYVWGNAITTTATTQNFHALQQPGSLVNSVVLPKTISDAMLFTKNMGQRYIWIDCFSVIQDSPAKHQDLANMDIIYSQAELTIVATTNKDANSGLAGVCPRTRRKRIISKRHGPYDIKLALPTSKFDLLGGTIYSSRGWTFQELALSKRVAFITEREVVFHCDTSRCSESTPREATFTNDHWGYGPIDFRTKRSLSVNVAATLDSYFTIVSEYSRRQLSFDHDIENAFAGLASILEGWCEGNPVTHGMMLSFFQRSMMWFFSWIGNDHPKEKMGKRRTGFPSWSWVGWIANVNYIEIDPRARLQFQSLIYKVEITTYAQIRDPISLYTLDITAREADAKTGGQRILVNLEPVTSRSLLTHPSTLGFDGERIEWKHFAANCTCMGSSESTFLFSIVGDSSPCGLLSVSPDQGIVHQVFKDSAPDVDCDWSIVRLYQVQVTSLNVEGDKLDVLFDHMGTKGVVEKKIIKTFRKRFVQSDLLYVLLIRREGLYWERIGSGLMFANEWPSNSTQAKIHAYAERIVLA